MAETGRVIYRRYLLQRLMKRGQACIVYQGFDQVLQRAVAVKVASAEHVSAYRAAIRATSQFSHPNIIGLYDLIVEPEQLYIVQEFVEGEDFAVLLQSQITPYQVVDLGAQVCQALLYASSPARKVCHGDLTPAAVIRERRGAIRVSNFALPSDMDYFSRWSVVGGDGIAVSDQELPWGQMSEQRRADDTRAVGLLLYQLLAGHSPGATSVEPPADGRLRFSRSAPAELCELIARTVIRKHPQHINTVEALHEELKRLSEALEPPVPVPAGFPVEEAVASRQYVGAGQALGTGKLATALPTRETTGKQVFGTVTNSQMTEMEVPRPSFPPSTPTNLSTNLAAARQAAYPEQLAANQGRRLNIPLLIFLGLLLFAFCFVIGYFVALH